MPSYTLTQRTPVRVRDRYPRLSLRGLIAQSGRAFPPFDMDVQLRDEAVRDRIRAAEEFLDPSRCMVSSC